ncbi:WD40 repeat-like protein [Wallemia mellicola]|nr:WD40 repeat-like protein [Wallemia mellicola]
MAINLDEDTHSAFNRMSTFMNGHGVYGPSCFLYSQYGGVGDIIQGYCRSSAVHGSTFILNHALESLEKCDSEYSVRLHNFEETFTVKKVISNAKNLYPNQPSRVISKIGRAVMVLNMPPNVDPLPESPILGYPPMAFGIRNAVHVHWQSSTSGVCPPGYYIIYFAATLSDNEEATLDELFEGYINSLTTSREDIEFLTVYVEEEREIDVKTDVELIKQEPTTFAPFVEPSEKAVEEASRVFELLTKREATEMFATTREKEEDSYSLSTMSEEDKVNNVPVILHSISSQHAIPEEMYMIPSNWKRYQLSQLINSLLENSKAIPFDFFVGEDGTGGKLSSVLSEISNGEETLHLSYIPSILPPKHLSTYLHDDWISSVSIRSHSDAKFLTGSYDGLASIWNSRNEKIYELAGHNGPVLDLSWVGDKAVTAGQDSTLKLWDIPESGKPSQLLAYTGHKNAVSSVRSAKPLTEGEPWTVLSADWDGLVCLWDTHIPSSHEVEIEDEEPSTKKRKKTKTVDVLRKAPLHQLRGHTGSVNGVAFSKSDPTVGYTGGADHSLKSWDLGVGLENDTRVGSSVIRCLDSLVAPSTIVSGHVDRSIALWDMRASSNISQKLLGHTSIVEAIHAHPTSPNHFASAGMDGNIKLWDIRSPKQSLFTVVRKPSNGKKENEKKILGLAWDSQILASGGEDCALQLHEASA